MATTYIQPSGGTYTTLFAWEDGQEGVLSAPEIGIIDGDWSVGADTGGGVAILGWTTDASNYISIYTTATARHSGKWDSNGYILSVTNEHAIDCNEDYVRIDGIQTLTNITDAAVHYGMRVSAVGTSDIRISNSIVKCTGSSAGANSSGIVITDADAVVKLWNNVVYGWTISTTALNGIYVTNGTVTAYNCTVYGSYYANYRRAGGTFNCYNCIGQACATADKSYNGTLGGDYNITEDGSGGTPSDDCPGANSFQAAVTFVNAGSGDFHLDASDTSGAKDGTTDQSSGLFTDDIDGDTRGATWDIGADEYTSGDQNLVLSTASAAAAAYNVTLTPGAVSLALGYASASAAANDVYVFGWQTARPDADVSDGAWLNESWSATNLYASIDETTPSDSDYIQSEGGPSNSPCEIGVANLSDPTIHIYHKVRYRYKKSATGDTIELKVSLMEGVTEIASWTDSDVSTSWTTTEQTLTEVQAGNITDYTNLSLKFTANPA